MSESTGFYLLDDRIQRFLWREGWEELRDAQERAIPEIVDAERDVIIAAATAAGKTEAAFLPALTHVAREKCERRLIIYISPLRALINDQFGRLDRLCEDLDVPVVAWHGESNQTKKDRFRKKPEGVLLITPESLEAMFCNRGSSMPHLAKQTAFCIIDEVHAFIGTERGKQLQSLLHRLERAADRKIPRIGLSATLGDISTAAEFMRPTGGGEVTIIESKSSHAEILVVLRGYEEPAQLMAINEENDQPNSANAIADHLFKALRGSNNLVFPNSRASVDHYTHLLSKRCAAAQVPNEFWPHHGNLSKDIRADAEAALRQKERPATAICTSTLELGIDIGAVKSIVQIDCPPSVASLRQRLGRSGRRKGEAAILRAYVVEYEADHKLTLEERLRLKLVQSVAMIELLLESWFEPPQGSAMHLSTFVQQLLSLIAQHGGITAKEGYATLCVSGAPFAGISTDDYKCLLSHLGKKDLITQEVSGTILLGEKGEKFVNHYSFFAAFPDDDEYRVVNGSKTLGSIPTGNVHFVGDHILFAGRPWRVDAIDDKEKMILVSSARKGAHMMYNQQRGCTHTRVRQKMQQLLATESEPAYLDATAKKLLRQARAEFQRLDKPRMLLAGDEVVFLTWLGDGAISALAALLAQFGWKCQHSQGLLYVSLASNPVAEVFAAFVKIAGSAAPTPDALLCDSKVLAIEKWDWALPDELLKRSFASSYLNINEAIEWCAITTRSK